MKRRATDARPTPYRFFAAAKVNPAAQKSMQVSYSTIYRLTALASTITAATLAGPLFLFGCFSSRSDYLIAASFAAIVSFAAAALIAASFAAVVLVTGAAIRRDPRNDPTARDIAAQLAAAACCIFIAGWLPVELIHGFDGGRRSIDVWLYE